MHPPHDKNNDKIKKNNRNKGKRESFILCSEKKMQKYQ